MNGWTIDNNLGIAMREVDEELHVRSLTADGRMRILAARDASYGSGDHLAAVAAQHGGQPGYHIIDSARRAAFVRALSPITEPEISGDY